MPHWRYTASLVLLLIAASIPVATRLFVGPPGAIVHVRWQAAIDDGTRAGLEQRFQLAEGDRLDERTWRYNLRDASSANIRAIVGHSAVDDTQHIDRRRSVIAASAARTPRQPRMAIDSDTLVRAADIISLVLGGLAAWLFVRTPAASAARRRIALWFAPFAAPFAWVEAVAGSVVRVLSRGMPDTTATAAGAFRIVFGTALIWFCLSHPENARALDNTFNLLVEGDLHAAVVQWMRDHTYVADAVQPWLLLTGVAFTLGAFTRVTYPLFVIGVLGWLFLATTHDSTHPHSTLGLTLVALLPSRWGDALSIDSWRRGNVREESGKRYGYSVWVPSLVFGIALAAAAWAKLSRPPGWTDWILNGSVKYHFITDAHNAPVDWGLQLAGHPWLAILASLGAVAVELMVVTAAFSRNETYRMFMGAAGMSLLVGFWLFMGVFWPGWWILLLGFLPWRRLTRQTRRITVLPPAGHPTWAQAAVIVMLVGQQVAFSAMRIERSPMFTYYPMYSSTYASSEQFNAAMIPYYRIVLTTDRGPVELACDAPEDLVEEFRVALGGSTEAAARVWRTVRGCAPNVGIARQVTLEGDRNVFDWERLRFDTARADIVLGPLAVPADAAVPPPD